MCLKRLVWKTEKLSQTKRTIELYNVVKIFKVKWTSDSAEHKRISLKLPNKAFCKSVIISEKYNDTLYNKNDSLTESLEILYKLHRFGSDTSNNEILHWKQLHNMVGIMCSPTVARFHKIIN